MKRLLVLLLVTVGLAATNGVALADHGDFTGRPQCADIAQATAGYGTNGVVTGQINTVEPSCRGVTYTLFIEIDSGEVVSYSSRGNGTTSVVVVSEAITTDADSFICFWVESSRGKTMFDRYPNEGCSDPIALGGSGGDIGHA